MSENNESRRPLQSRGSWWSKIILNLLLKTPITPNQVSLGSVGFACLAALGFLFVGNSPSVFMLIIAIVGMQGRLVCNLMDGMLAVEGSRESRAGELYNEIPDRVSDVIIILGAAYGYAYSPPYISSVTSIGWIASLFAVLTAYIRVFGASVGAGQHFLGPMAKPHRMALLTGTCLLEIILTCLGLYTPLVPLALIIMIIGCGATLYRRLNKIYLFLLNEH